MNYTSHAGGAAAARAAGGCVAPGRRRRRGGRRVIEGRERLVFDAYKLRTARIPKKRARSRKESEVDSDAHPRVGKSSAARQPPPPLGGARRRRRPATLPPIPGAHPVWHKRRGRPATGRLLNARKGNARWSAGRRALSSPPCGRRASSSCAPGGGGEAVRCAGRAEAGARQLICLRRKEMTAAVEAALLPATPDRCARPPARPLPSLPPTPPPCTGRAAAGRGRRGSGRGSFYGFVPPPS